MSKAIRLGWIKGLENEIAWQDFQSQWPAYIRIPVSGGIIDRSSSICWRHGLQAYEAVHLVSALMWKDISGDQVVLACFDRNLLKAAQQEGLYYFPESLRFD